MGLENFPVFNCPVWPTAPSRSIHPLNFSRHKTQGGHLASAKSITGRIFDSDRCFQMFIASWRPSSLGRCQAVPSAQSWQQLQGPWYTYLQSDQKWSQGKTCNQKAIPQTWEQSQMTHLCMKTQDLGCSTMALGALDWWVQVWNIYTQEEGSLFIEGLENTTRMSVCRQQ